MSDHPGELPVVEGSGFPDAAPPAEFPSLAVLVLTFAVFSCSLYANLSFAVTNPKAYRFFPPFRSQVDANHNRHLGAEYFNIARSMQEGKGFANPFQEPTGPTAWTAPLFASVLAGLLLLFDGSREAVMAVVVLLQVGVLLGTGCLVLALARQTTRQVGAAVAVTAFLALLLCDFQWYFQFTDDWWLVLLALDLLVAGLCWIGPLRGWWRAAGWGLFGGLCALINPVVAFGWGVASLLVGLHQRSWSSLGIAALAAGLLLAPWTVRNYQVFGRLIPVKANLAYELYQSQCLQPDGLLQLPTFSLHPYVAKGREGREYKEFGETAYLDRKWQQFGQSARANPADFIERVAHRFLGATLWYEPLDRAAQTRPWVLLLRRLTHPLPFLALLLLVLIGAREHLHGAHWVGVGVYLLYLSPYVVMSYYDRYAVPLLGVKVLLILWAADRVLSSWFGKGRERFFRKFGEWVRRMEYPFQSQPRFPGGFLGCSPCC